MSSAATFSFACQCGAKLQARADMAGKKGKCKFCSQTFVIPAPAVAPTTLAPASESAPARKVAAAPVRQQVCSICQTSVQPHELAAKCDACGLPFHVECWQANLGCATYGCRNVNCLKPGPDIAIAQTALAQPQAGPSLPRQAAQTAPSQEIPWDYILLAAAAVAGLLSCVTCGLPSLVVALAAAGYMHTRPRFNQKVMIAVWCIVASTTILGIMSSCVVFLLQ